METIKLDIKNTLEFISKDVLSSYEAKAQTCMNTLENVPEPETIFWDGSIFHLLLLKNF